MLLAGVGLAIVGSLAALMREVAEVAQAGRDLRRVVNESRGVLVEGPDRERFLLQAPNENLYLSRCPAPDALLAQAAYGRGLMQAIALRIRGMDGDDPSLPHARWWADPGHVREAVRALREESQPRVPATMLEWLSWAMEADEATRRDGHRGSTLTPRPMRRWLEVLDDRCRARLGSSLVEYARRRASSVLVADGGRTDLGVLYDKTRRELDIRVDFESRWETRVPGEPRRFILPGSESELQEALRVYRGTDDRAMWDEIDMAAHRLARVADMHPAVLGAVVDDPRVSPQGGSWRGLVIGILRDALVSAGRRRITADAPPRRL